MLALSAAVTSVGQLFALRVGIGLFGGIGPLGLAMATAQAPREETGRAVGLVQAAQILSAAVGPFAGGVLADAIGIRAHLPRHRRAVRAGARCSSSPSTRSAARPERARRGRCAWFRRVVALPGVLALLAVLFVVNFIGRSFTPILPLHLAELGVPAAGSPRPRASSSRSTPSRPRSRPCCSGG